MDAKALLEERTELFKNVYQFKHNKRVPIYSNVSYWNIFDAGYGLAEASYDYDKLGKSMDEFCERYQFDAYMQVGGGMSVINITKEHGPHNLCISKDGNAMVLDDYCVMEREEYPEVRENFDRFLWAKDMKRKLPSTLKIGDWQDMVKKVMENLSYNAKMLDQLNNKHGALAAWKSGVTLPLETVLGYLRGIKNTSLDLRKCKGELKETLDAFYEKDCVPVLESMAGVDYTGSVSAVQIALLATSVLNNRQFEELYWPYMKRTINFCVAHELPVFLYCEAEVVRFAEFFQEIPKGAAILQVEQDDIFEARKKLPHLALAGGMPLDLLGYGTKQECIDYAKKLIDTLGDGYVMTQDKMACTKNDIKRENLLAVNDFVRNYQY